MKGCFCFTKSILFKSMPWSIVTIAPFKELPLNSWLCICTIMTYPRIALQKNRLIDSLVKHFKKITKILNALIFSFLILNLIKKGIWDFHVTTQSVQWGINPPFKNTPPFFLPTHSLNLQTVQVPLIRQFTLCNGFSWRPPPPKNPIFQ